MNSSKLLFLFCMVWIMTTGIIFPDKIDRDTLTAGIEFDPNTLDPAQAWDDSITLIAYNIYDTLIGINPVTGALEPSLALSWECKPDGTTWIFKLREGVKFHDGSPFNADAVVFTFQRQLDKNFKYRYYDFSLYKEIFPTLREVKKIDNYRVAFYLTEPFYPFLSSLTSSPSAIVSPEAVKKYGKDYPSHPVGTGPFKLKSWDKLTRIAIERNPHYWGAKPSIREFIGYVQSTASAHRLFKQQKLDMIFLFSASWTVGLRMLDWVGIYQSIYISSNFIALNFKNKLIRDKNVRKVLLYSWDPRFLKYSSQGFHEQSSGSFISPSMLGFEKDLYEYPYSMEKAGEYARKINSKGKVKLDFLLIETDSRLQLVRFYACNLKKSGIELNIVKVSFQEYFERIAEEKYDLVFSNWIPDYPDTHSMIFPMFSEKLKDEGVANMVTYTDRNLRPEIQKAATESDTQKRAEIYKNINRLIREEILCIPFSHRTMDFLYNKTKIENIYIDKIGVLCLRMIRKK